MLIQRNQYHDNFFVSLPLRNLSNPYFAVNHSIRTGGHLVLVHSIPFWLVWAEIECTVQQGQIVVLACCSAQTNWLTPVQQSMQQVLRSYCLNIYYTMLSITNGVSNTATKKLQNPLLLLWFLYYHVFLHNLAQCCSIF